MKKDKFHEETLRLLIFVIGIFSICILLLSFKLKVNAASPSGQFPYIVPANSDLNTFYTDSALESAIYFYENSIINNTSVDTYFVYTDYGVINGSYYSFCFVPNPTITSTITPSYDYVSNYISVRANDSQIVRLMVNTSSNSIDASNALGYNVNLLGTVSTSSIGNGVYTPNYPFFMKGSDIYFGYNNDGFTPILIFTNIVPFTPDVFESGHAQEPSYDSDTIIDSSLHPNIKPTFPTINNYTFNTYTPPSIDTSTIESILESIWDNLTYSGGFLVNNIGGAINNLNSNVSSVFTYVSDLFSYLANRIVNTIKQSSNNLFENFRDLFEPVLNSFANLVNIFNTLYGLGLKEGSFDIPTLFGNLLLPNPNDLDLLLDSYFTDFDTFVYFTGSIKSLMLGIFDTLNDDPTYSIHIQGFTYHGIIIPTQEISFDWYLPYKSTGDIFISAFLIVGYLFWLFARIPGIFHGMAPDANMASHISDPYTPSGSNGFFDY